MLCFTSDTQKYTILIVMKEKQQKCIGTWLYCIQHWYKYSALLLINSLWILLGLKQSIHILEMSACIPYREYKKSEEWQGLTLGVH